jgi:hypothetical protein
VAEEDSRSTWKFIRSVNVDIDATQTNTTASQPSTHPAPTPSTNTTTTHTNLANPPNHLPPIPGGGCLFNTTGTALSEAALSEFHNSLQNPSSSSPYGSAQNDLPTLPPSLSPVKSKIRPQNTKPAVVYVVLESETKPA